MSDFNGDNDRNLDSNHAGYLGPRDDSSCSGNRTPSAAWVTTPADPVVGRPGPAAFAAGGGVCTPAALAGGGRFSGGGFGGGHFGGFRR